jgi:hypothetical protein
MDFWKRRGQCGLWAAVYSLDRSACNGPSWPGWPSRPRRHRINEEGAVRVSPNPQPPLLCRCRCACWRRRRRWPAGRPAVVRGGPWWCSAASSLPLFYLRPWPPCALACAAGRWSAFRGQRWGAPTRSVSRCRVRSLGGGRRPLRGRRGFVRLRPPPGSPAPRRMVEHRCGPPWSRP